MSKLCCKFCGNEFEATGIKWSLDNNLLIVDDIEIQLSSSLGELFDCLYTNIGRAVSKQRLLISIYGGYGTEPEYASSAISVYIHKLRKAIASTSLKIKNIFATGYLLELPASLSKKASAAS